MQTKMATNRDNSLILSMITALFAENSRVLPILIIIRQRHKIRHFLIGVAKNVNKRHV